MIDVQFCDCSKDGNIISTYEQKEITVDYISCVKRAKGKWIQYVEFE